jgi:predicted ester cyclase
MSKADNIAVQALGGPIAEARDWERFDEVFAPDFIDHDPGEGQPTGVEGIKKYWRDFTTAFPDFELTPDVITADDEYVTLVYRVSGTHTGEYEGHAPTGRKFTIRSLQTTKFANGRVVERWGSSDMLGLHQQLGLV